MKNFVTHDGAKPHLQPTARDIATVDSFENFLTMTGVGTANVNSASHYGFNPVSRNRLQLEWCYRGSWIAGKAVDAVAEDMTREGVELHTDDTPKDIQALEKSMRSLQVWESLSDAIAWGRLYGGSLAFIMIEGQDPSTPLRPETIQRGQFRGLLPLDRWLLQPSLMDLVQEPGPHYGKPKFYDTVVDINGGIPRMRMHYSRCIRFDGQRLPYWQRITENLWGISVLERLWDRLIAFDSVTNGAAQLVYKAYLRVVRLKGLRQIIAQGGTMMAAVAKQMQMIRAYQSNEGITLLDQEDEFATHNYTFSGLDSIMLQFGQQLSGSLDIPLVRLFGQSPSGLNATGESDMSIYRQGIKQRQKSNLQAGVELVYDVGYRSEFGKDRTGELEFKPLDAPTDDERADITGKVTDSVTKMYESGIINRSMSLKELRALARITGAFSTITDEDIEKAVQDDAQRAEQPPDPAELGLDPRRAEEGADVKGTSEDRPRRAGLRVVA